MMTIRMSLIVLILLVSMSFAQAQTATPFGGENIHYIPGGDPAQILTVALPDLMTVPYPTVLLFHGRGSSTTDMIPQRDYLVAQGYAVVSVDFRAQGGTSNMLADAFCALAWVHSNAATYNFDLARIASIGYSYSGWQAALLGTVNKGSEFLSENCPNTLPEDSRVQAVITYGGTLHTPRTLIATRTDLSDEQVEYLEYLAQVPPPQWSDFLGQGWIDFLRPYPMYWLESTDAPFFVIHSQDDDTTAAYVTSYFFDTAHSAGINVSFLRLSGGKHDLLLFNGQQIPEADAAALAFLNQHLKVQQSPGATATPNATSTPPSG